MNTTRDTKKSAEKLAEISIHPDKREELWNTIAERIDAQGTEDVAEQPGHRGQHKRRRLVWGQVGAAVAAVAVLAIGVPVYRNHVARNATAANSPSNQTSTVPGTLTPRDIKQYYAKNHRQIVSVHSYPEYHAEIVESDVGPNVDDTFDWWDMGTGKHEMLVGPPNYLSIDTVINANEIVFSATGKTIVDPNISFPFYIDVKRNNPSSPWVSTIVPEYIPVQGQITFGDIKVEALSQLLLTSKGIKMGFAPQNGESQGAFAAGIYGAPMTTVSYAGGDLVLTMKRTTLSLTNAQLQGMHNAYVQSVSAKQIGNNVQVILHLSKQAKYYTGAITHQSKPTMTLSFMQKNPAPWATPNDSSSKLGANVELKVDSSKMTTDAGSLSALVSSAAIKSYTLPGTSHTNAQVLTSVDGVGTLVAENTLGDQVGPPARLFLLSPTSQSFKQIASATNNSNDTISSAVLSKRWMAWTDFIPNGVMANIGILDRVSGKTSYVASTSNEQAFMRKGLQFELFMRGNSLFVYGQHQVDEYNMQAHVWKTFFSANNEDILGFQLTAQGEVVELTTGQGKEAITFDQQGKQVGPAYILPKAVLYTTGRSGNSVVFDGTNGTYLWMPGGDSISQVSNVSSWLSGTGGQYVAGWGYASKQPGQLLDIQNHKYYSFNANSAFATLKQLFWTNGNTIYWSNLP